MKASGRQVFTVFLTAGAQSFGGGTATLFLIRRDVVEKHGWLTDDDFTRFFALCQITPGINLLALAVLIGRRVAGTGGIVAALSGLLLPSAVIAVLMTAGYARVRDLPLVKAALRGVIAASVGFSAIEAYRLALSPLRESRSEGAASLTLACTLLLASLAAMLLWRPPALLLLLGAGAVGAAGSVLLSKKPAAS